MLLVGLLVLLTPLSLVNISQEVLELSSKLSVTSSYAKRSANEVADGLAKGGVGKLNLVVESFFPKFWLVAMGASLILFVLFCFVSFCSFSVYVSYAA